MKAQSEKKHGSDKEERGKLPESPKTAEEIWQQSVIGDYLARFKVRGRPGMQLEPGAAPGLPRASLPGFIPAAAAWGWGGEKGPSLERVPWDGAGGGPAR